MMIKLETLFANLLLAKKISLVVDYNGNKKQIKKKLKQKAKVLLQKVEDSIARDKEIKRDKEEAERQRIMYIMAEREKTQNLF